MTDSATPKDVKQMPPSKAVAGEHTGHTPIRRGEHARDRVLRAALEVLADEGLPTFTMEAVARRSRASKATVYRHWASREALLVDAMELMAEPLPLPATGQLRTDLIELVSVLESQLNDQPLARLMAAFIDAAERNPTLWNLTQLTERRRGPFRHVLAEARQRGDIPATTDVEFAVDLLNSPIFYRRFVAHGPFPADYASNIVDHVLTAISHTASGDPE